MSRSAEAKTGNIYVKGLLVAREDNFLFSYNIKSLTKSLRDALNRERSNVGRTAYTDRVKAILKQCSSESVARTLADELENYRTRPLRDELTWIDITVHACRVLASYEKVVFVTASQLADGSAQLQYAIDDGYRLVLVPDDVARKVAALSDIEGNPILDFEGYRDTWNESFSFKFVEPTTLSEKEISVWRMTDAIVKSSGVTLHTAGVDKILISETMRLNSHGDSVRGVYEARERRIIIRRDRLMNPVDYCGTLLHELVHADSGTSDLTLDFEQALTRQLGVLGVALIRQDS